MTRKERVFRHIEDNGNAMRYTDIIKFAYEDKYGKGTFDKRNNRGFYACAFTYHSYWSARFSERKKNIGSPKGHFVTPTKNGQLVKLSNGLWSVHRPLGWTRESGNCQSYEARIEKFLSDGKSYVERDIVSHIKPYVVQHRGKIGYDWGNTNALLRKMIEKGKVVRDIDINPKTNRPAYFYALNVLSTEKSNDLLEMECLPKDDYKSMCDSLKMYNISANDLDSLATEYFWEGKCSIEQCYNHAYSDLLEKAGAIENATKELEKEIDKLADLVVEDSRTKEPVYIVIDKDDSYYRGRFTLPELQEFFADRDPEDYVIMELGKIVSLEKKVTTTFTIK
jgi:hypothetical protein